MSWVVLTTHILPLVVADLFPAESFMNVVGIVIGKYSLPREMLFDSLR